MPTKKNIHPIDLHIGRRIRERRMIRGISQTVLAENQGITFQQVQKYEKGTNRVSGSRLAGFAMYLGVGVEWFYEGAPGMNGNGHHKKQDREAEELSSFMSTNQGIALNRAFLKIGSTATRRRLVELTSAIAGEMEPA